MAEKRITVEDRFVKPCAEFPKGLWTRRIGNGEWETVSESCPVIFFDDSITHGSMFSESEKENL